jgi:hypothetical protein
MVSGWSHYGVSVVLVWCQKGVCMYWYGVSIVLISIVSRGNTQGHLAASLVTSMAMSICQNRNVTR